MSKDTVKRKAPAAVKAKVAAACTCDKANVLEKVKISGFGGQGVLLLGQFLSRAAMELGLNTTWFPNYGPEMRGGTCACNVVMASDEVASPVIPAPDTMICFSKPAFDKYGPTVRKGGCLIVNSSIVKDKFSRSDVKVYYVEANKLAQMAGNPLTTNTVMLGVYVKISGLFCIDAVKKMITAHFKDKPELVLANIGALELGYAAV